jgi:hypothetical protein
MYTRTEKEEKRREGRREEEEEEGKQEEGTLLLEHGGDELLQLPHALTLPELEEDAPKLSSSSLSHGGARSSISVHKPFQHELL